MSLKDAACLIALSCLFIFISNCSNQNYDHTSELKITSNSIHINDEFSTNVVKEDTLYWLSRWKGEGAREKLVREVHREFSFLNQEAHIELVFPQDDPEIQLQPGDNDDDKAANAVAAGLKANNLKWDIIPNATYRTLNDSMGSQTWHEDYIVDFRNVEGFEKTQQPLTYNPDEFSFGPAIEGSYVALYYNRKVAEEIGIEVKEYGMTYDDIMGYILALKKYNQKNQTNIIGMTEIFGGTWHISYNFIECLHISKTDVLEPQTDITEEMADNMLKTFKDIEALVELGAFDPQFGIRSNDESVALPLNGEALFHINGSWIYNQWHALDSVKVQDMIPCELPTFKPMDFYEGGYNPVFSVMRNSPQKELAIDLVLFWASQDVVDDWMAYTKTPSGGKGSIEATGIGGDKFESFVRHLNQRYKGKLIGTTIGAFFGTASPVEVSNIFLDNYNEFMRGEISADALHQMIIDKHDEML